MLFDRSVQGNFALRQPSRAVRAPELTSQPGGALRVYPFHGSCRGKQFSALRDWGSQHLNRSSAADAISHDI